MNSEHLKAIVIERFRAVGMLHCLDLEDSKFNEMSTFFEVSHLVMELSISDPLLAPVACSLMNQLKSDLFQEHGVELEVVVRAQTLVGK